MCCFPATEPPPGNDPAGRPGGCCTCTKTLSLAGSLEPLHCPFQHPPAAAPPLSCFPLSRRCRTASTCWVWGWTPQSRATPRPSSPMCLQRRASTGCASWRTQVSGAGDSRQRGIAARAVVVTGCACGQCGAGRWAWYIQHGG
jgi:hypothetical protein